MGRFLSDLGVTELMMRGHLLLVVAFVSVFAWGCRRGDSERGVSRPSSTVVQSLPPSPEKPATKTACASGQKVVHYADVTQYQKVARRTGKPEGERLAGILAIMRKELRDPGQATMGLGGGPIDSGYVLKVGTGILGREVGAERLKSARRKEPNPEMRQLLAVALALAGDASLTPEVRRLARAHRYGRVRAGALMALAEQRNPDNRLVFLSSLQDRFSAIEGLEGPGEQPRRSYPVRASARIGLMSLGEALPAGTVISMRVPLSASNPELYSYLLQDRDPESCLAGVRLLIREGEQGRPYLETFIRQNENEPSLKASVALARRSLPQNGSS